MDKFGSFSNKPPSKKQMDDLKLQITTGLRHTEKAMGKEPSYDEEGNLLGRPIPVPGTLSKPRPKPPSKESDYFRPPNSSDISGVSLPPGIQQPSQTQLPSKAQFTPSNEYLLKYGTTGDVARIARRNENTNLKRMIREVITTMLVNEAMSRAEKRGELPEMVGDPSRPPSPPTPAMRKKKFKLNKLKEMDASVEEGKHNKIMGLPNDYDPKKRNQSAERREFRVKRNNTRDKEHLKLAMAPEVDPPTPRPIRVPDESGVDQIARREWERHNAERKAAIAAWKLKDLAKPETWAQARPGEQTVADINRNQVRGIPDGMSENKENIPSKKDLSKAIEEWDLMKWPSEHEWADEVATFVRKKLAKESIGW